MESFSTTKTSNSKDLASLWHQSRLRGRLAWESHTLDMIMISSLPADERGADILRCEGNKQGALITRSRRAHPSHMTAFFADTTTRLIRCAAHGSKQWHTVRICLLRSNDRTTERPTDRPTILQGLFRGGNTQTPCRR
jgi:hypothetical protein